MLLSYLRDTDEIDLVYRSKQYDTGILKVFPSVKVVSGLVSSVAHP